MKEFMAYIYMRIGIFFFRRLFNRVIIWPINQPYVKGVAFFTNDFWMQQFLDYLRTNHEKN